MLPLSKFFSTQGGTSWVLAGKGPSFAVRPEKIPYPVLGLNHVCLQMECNLIHFTDLRAFLDCHNQICEGFADVAMPWFPHVNNKPGKKSLKELAEEYGGLEDLDYSRRLYTYNSTLAKYRREGLSTHTTRYFSAVVGLHILAYHGVKKVFTLGIDGGSSYSPEFDTSTLLENGRSSFDVQFKEMDKIAKKFGVEVRPLVKEMS